MRLDINRSINTAKSKKYNGTMATNQENRFFAKAEEYQNKLKTNELCPKKYYTRHTDPRNLTETQLYFDKRTISKRRQQVKTELKFLNYNLSKISYNIAKHERLKAINQAHIRN